MLTPQLASILPGVVYQAVTYPDGSQRCLYVNEAIRSLTGLTPDQVFADTNSFNQLIHPSDRIRIRRATQEHNRTLKPWSQQYRLALPDQGTKWLQSVAHIERLVDGSVLWTGFITDVTSIKRAEEALQISEERISLAARAGKVGLWDYDFLTHEIIWNETQYEIHGVHPDTYTPNLANNLQFLHPEGAEQAKQAFADCVNSGQHEYLIECKIIRADGEVRTTRSSAFIIRNENGEPIRAVGTEVDVTEERRILETLARAREVAESATRAKSEFLARMSHEIRTPMNAIVAPATLLADSVKSPLERELADMIVSAAAHLLQVVNDILDFSKLEAGKMILASESFSLSSMVGEIMGPMQALADQKQIKLRAVFDRKSHDLWIGDQAKIKQVLFNLISNAIKFTSHGEVRLDITRKRTTRELTDISFSVSDTGIGILEEDLKSLFQPFEQVRPRQTDYQSGTGLGLAICRELVELMHGRIDAESQDGQGSRFSFTIPCRRGKSHPRPRASNRKLPVKKSASQARILVAEDNASNRRIIGLVLKRLGYQTEDAINGREAVEKCLSGNFDLVLMDSEMPLMNGLAAVRQIRQSGQKIPIVGLTAHVSPEHQQACRTAGMDAVLSKPVIAVELAATLQRLIS